MLIKIKHNLPNFLTFFRLFSAPIFVILFYINADLTKLISAILFVACGITDFLDGVLARHWNVESKIGRIFDPIADKLIVIAAIVMLIYDKSINNLNIFAAMAILLREVIISGLREAISGLDISLASSFLGKLKTFIQILSISILIFTNIAFFSNFLYLKIFALILFWFSAFLSVYSGFQYLKKTLKILN